MRGTPNLTGPQLRLLQWRSINGHLRIGGVHSRSREEDA